MLAQVAEVVETPGLQIDVLGPDLRQRRLGQNGRGDIRDCAIGDFVDEGDVPVFAGCNAGATSRLVISGSTTASRPRRP